jgi:hypothetical protein
VTRREHPRAARFASVGGSLVLVGVALVTAACGAVPLPCDVTIAAVPVDGPLVAGDVLPSDLVVLVAPREIDQTETAIETDQSGGPQVIVKATGDGAARLADHTGTHIGGAVAIAINGTVVAVPFVNSAILDGALAISPATADQGEFAKQFAGCVRAPAGATD